jgi:hypothetical protein
LERSALVEALVQFTRALDQIAVLPSTPALRRQQMKFQVAIITPLIHVEGYGAPETKSAVERARLLIEQAEAIGEPPEDPLLLLSVLYGIYVATLIAFDGDACREVATQFLALAERQGGDSPAYDRVSPISLQLGGKAESPTSVRFASISRTSAPRNGETCSTLTRRSVITSCPTGR